MAVPVNTQQTFVTIGNREALADMIYRIAPTDTEFLSSISKTSVDNTLFEWQTQDLASAANNAQVEGDDANILAVVPTARPNNRTQISTKAVSVSGTQNTGMNQAGRDKELNYQKLLRGIELKRDMEFALCQNSTAIAGSAAVARQTRGLEGWIATNNDLGAGGVAPNPGTNTAATDGTARAFTEAQVKTVMQLIWLQGGDPDKIMVGGTQKQTFSTFTGNATRFDKAEDSKVVASTDVYVGDFGSVKIVANRFQRARTAFVLETKRWQLAQMRPLVWEPLAKTGDSEKGMLIVEYGLKSHQEKASGAVRDLL